MSSRAKKIILVVLAAVLLVGSSQIQRALNRDREKLGLTWHTAVLDNAPPVLAFTTVALGGFRGLIANALWIRLSDMQDEDKFFEIQQLADWITKLEPHFPQVWVNAAWNMSYNISVKFKENSPGVYSDRWRWVQAGISLLRDEGLKYNPTDVLIHRELGWHFQHKMGANLDDANMYYKRQWLDEMQELFGNEPPNFEELIHPQTPEQIARVYTLTNKYKLDPAFMKKVDETYGPLEWRLPESQAVYWGAKGLDMAEKYPSKVKADDLIQLRRLIYQSMQASFRRGRLVKNLDEGIDFGPNLEIIPKTNFAYEEAIRDDEKARANIQGAHRNFLKDAVYFLYSYNRIGEAQKWYAYLCEKYPDKPVIENKPESLPCKTSMDDYAISRLMGDVGETDRDRIKAVIEGLIGRAIVSRLSGEDRFADGSMFVARVVWKRYMDKIKSREMAIGLPTIEETEREIVAELLDPKNELPAELRTRLRVMRGLPPETNSGTNAPSVPAIPSTTTNAPAGTNR